MPFTNVPVASCVTPHPDPLPLRGRGNRDDSLSLGEAGEDARGRLLDGGGEVAGPDDAEDGGQIAMREMGVRVRPRAGVAGGDATLVSAIVVIADVHLDLGGPEGALHHFPPLQRVPLEVQLAKLIAERLEREPGIDEGAQNHVAGGAARAVEVRDRHGQPALCVNGRPPSPLPSPSPRAREALRFPRPRRGRGSG